MQTQVPLLAVPDKRETVIIIEWAVVFGLTLLTAIVTRIQPMGEASGLSQLKMDGTSLGPPVMQENQNGSFVPSGNSGATRSHRLDVDVRGASPEPSRTQQGQQGSPV